MRSFVCGDIYPRLSRGRQTHATDERTAEGLEPEWTGVTETLGVSECLFAESLFATLDVGATMRRSDDNMKRYNHQKERDRPSSYVPLDKKANA